MAILRPDEYNHNNSNYAIVDASNIRGGHRSVTNIVGLQNIPEDKRFTGMSVSVVHYDLGNIGATTGGEFVKLDYPLDNLSDSSFQNISNWIQASGGSGGPVSADNVSFDDSTTTITASEVQTAIEELDTTTTAHDAVLSGLGTASVANTGNNQGQIPLITAAGTLPESVIPVININNITVVDTIAERDALTGMVSGDVCVVNDADDVQAGDQRKTYMWNGSTWIEIASPVDDVRLAATITTSTVTISSPASSTDAIILAVTDTEAGIMVPTQKIKLDGIEDGAEANVLPDWDATVGQSGEILNKPTNLTDLGQHVLTEFSDVAAPSPTAGEVLQWDGVNWVAGSSNGVLAAEPLPNETVRLTLTGSPNAIIPTATDTLPGVLSSVDFVRISVLSTATAGTKLTADVNDELVFTDDIALNVPYNNSGSGLVATNVQTAIDEVLSFTSNVNAADVQYDTTAWLTPPEYVSTALDVLRADVDTLNGVAVQVLYVDKDATGAHNGTSWENAFNNIASAFAVATAGATILIASGTYYADETDRTVSLIVPPNITIEGGYFNTPQGYQHVPEVYPTYISGDIPTASTVEERTQVLFDMTGANNTTVRHLIFRQVYNDREGFASYAAWLALPYVTGVLIEHCQFDEGWSSVYPFTISGGKVQIKNCTINDCNSVFHVSNGAGTLIDCTITNATGGVSPIVYTNKGSFTMAGCNFKDCTSDYGMYSGNSESTDTVESIINCTYQNCASGYATINLRGTATSIAQIANCVFTNNTVGAGYSEIVNQVEQSARILNNTIIGNAVSIKSNSSTTPIINISNNVCTGTIDVANNGSQSTITNNKCTDILVGGVSTVIPNNLLGDTTFNHMYEIQRDEISLTYGSKLLLTILLIPDYDVDVVSYDLYNRDRGVDDAICIGAIQSSIGSGLGGRLLEGSTALDGTAKSINVAGNVKTYVFNDLVATQTFTIIGLSDTEEVTAKRILDNSNNTVDVTVTWPEGLTFEFGKDLNTLKAGVSYSIDIKGESSTTAEAIAKTRSSLGIGTMAIGSSFVVS